MDTSILCDVLHEDIVNEVKNRMPARETFSHLADLYKMFADNTRVQILFALECREMCVCDLASLLNITKSAVSHQLKSLRLMNLIKNRKEGKIVYYSLADSHVQDILKCGFEHVNE